MVGAPLGVAGFTALMQTGAAQDGVQKAAGHIGFVTLAIAAIVDLVVSVIVLVWLTRPTEPRANTMGRCRSEWPDV